MIERTLIIIKPRAMKENKFSKILTMVEEKGYHLVTGKVIKLSKAQAEGFYHVHKGKEFYDGLVKFMLTGRIFVSVWEGENIILGLRKLMGKTNPLEAKEGTIRQKFAHNVRENCIHGSDSTQSADSEIPFFFSENELIME